MTLKARLTLAALLAYGVGTSTLAQDRAASPAGYRTGVPPVMTPPLAPPPDAASERVSARFKRWYAASKSPAILIFWNRELTDDATTRYADVTKAREQDHTAKSGGPGGETDVQTKASEQESYKRALTGGSYSPLDASVSSRLETAFQEAWLADGVEIVDRNAVIRKLATVASQADRSDLQILESAALEQGVEYLVEVLPMQANAAPGGVTFKVKVVHVPNSTVMAQFMSRAEPPPGPVDWTATPEGFRQVSENRSSPETIGAELAFETMDRLAH
jgi:hypothetical protein